MGADRRIPLKALLLVSGVLAASAVFVTVLALVERASQQRQAARIEQWGQQLARQDQWLQQVRSDLIERARTQIERGTPPRATPPAQPALVLKEQEAYLLQDGRLQKILTPIDLSAVVSVVLAVKPPPGQVELTNAAALPRRQIQVFIFSWPGKELLGMETFSDQPMAAPNGQVPTGLALSERLSVRDAELWRHLRVLSGERTAEAGLDHWLTNPPSRSAQPPEARKFN